MQGDVDILKAPFPMILVLYPVGTPSWFFLPAGNSLRMLLAAGLTLLGALVLLPLLFHHHRRHGRWPQSRWPYAVFATLSTFAFLACGAAFGVTVFLFVTAKNKFQTLGLEASYGPSVCIRYLWRLELF